MNYKRLEIYVWWTCNQKCTYCCEFPRMEKEWNNKISKYDILKELIKYKKLNYNHVTFLWWEPFIQWVFLDALKIWKKLWFTILVTTNATTLHLENQAIKFLPYIDELILSVEAIDKDLQQKISRTNVFVDWEKVFVNINKHWNWSYFKSNIVITKDNLSELFNIVKFISSKWVKNIAITYPDILIDYYTIKHVKTRVAVTYRECMVEIIKIFNYCKKNNIKLKIVDIPFCTFPKSNLDEFIVSTDDYDYWTRIKIQNDWTVLDRKDLKKTEDLPRDRSRESKCNKCLYKWKCWGPSIHYEKLFWLDEINFL